MANSAQIDPKLVRKMYSQVHHILKPTLVVYHFYDQAEGGRQTTRLLLNPNIAILLICLFQKYASNERLSLA